MDSSPVGDQKPEVWGCLDVSLGSAKLGTPNEHLREMPRASEHKCGIIDGFQLSI